MVAPSQPGHAPAVGASVGNFTLDYMQIQYQVGRNPNKSPAPPPRLEALPIDRKDLPPAAVGVPARLPRVVVAVSRAVVEVPPDHACIWTRTAASYYAGHSTLYGSALMRKSGPQKNGCTHGPRLSAPRNRPRIFGWSRIQPILCSTGPPRLHA